MLHTPCPQNGGHSVISVRVGVGIGVVVGGIGDVVSCIEFDALSVPAEYVTEIDLLRLSERVSAVWLRSGVLDRL